MPGRQAVPRECQNMDSLALFGIKRHQVVSVHPAHCTTHGTTEISNSKTLCLLGAEAVGNVASFGITQVCARQFLPPTPSEHHIWCSVGPILYRPTTHCAWMIGWNQQDSSPNPHDVACLHAEVPEHHEACFLRRFWPPSPDRRIAPGHGIVTCAHLAWQLPNPITTRSYTKH